MSEDYFILMNELSELIMKFNENENELSELITKINEVVLKLLDNEIEVCFDEMED